MFLKLRCIDISRIKSLSRDVLKHEIDEITDKIIDDYIFDLTISIDHIIAFEEDIIVYCKQASSYAVDYSMLPGVDGMFRGTKYEQLETTRIYLVDFNESINAVIKYEDFCDVLKREDKLKEVK